MMIHLVSTFLMVGLILFVQIVHYPLMARVGAAHFEAYEAGHTFRTGLLVVPLMTAELATAVWLAAVPGAVEHRVVALAGLGLLAVIWLSTAFLQAPAHRRLTKGFDAAVHTGLVRTNWIRTMAWVARVPVVLAILPQ
jgi:hypothetical protein